MKCKSNVPKTLRVTTVPKPFGTLAPKTNNKMVIGACMY